MWKSVSQRSHTFLTVMTHIRTFSLNSGTSIKNLQTTEYSLERSFPQKWEYNKRFFSDFFGKTLHSNFKEASMKKLLLDTCTKTAFTFNRVIYGQKDGVCIGSNLGPDLDFTVELSPDGISIFRKNRNTGLYSHVSSYVLWTHRAVWIKSLASHASCICLPNKLSSKINLLRN